MPFFDPNTSTTNIKVIWNAAASPYCGRILYYVANISSDKHSDIVNDTINVTLSTASDNVFTITFSNLRNDTNYDVAVFAVNSEGDGMPTTIRNIMFPSSGVIPGMFVCFMYIYKCKNHKTPNTGLILKQVHKSCQILELLGFLYEFVCNCTVYVNQTCEILSYIHE